jgi:hypothetical protein
MYLQISTLDVPFMAYPFTTAIGYLDTCTVKSNDNVVA